MKASTGTTKVVKTVTVDEPTVVLELSNYEAEVLAAALYHIGGSPEGARGVFDKMTQALRSLDIYTSEASRKFPTRGVICFI
jgi:hypothetical protein